MSFPNIGNRNGTPETSSGKLPSFRLPKGNDSKKMDELLGAGEIAKEYKKIESLLNQRKVAGPAKKLELRPLSGTKKEPHTDSNNPNNANNVDNSSAINNSLQESFDGSRIGKIDSLMRGVASASFDQEDVNEKIMNLEKMNNFLLETVNRIEKQLQNEIKKTKIMVEGERDVRARIETSVRYTEEQQSLTSNELSSKISSLESRLAKEEKSKADLREKLMITEQNQKEMLSYLKNLQHTDNSEMLQMRGLIHERVSEDSLALAKEREKSKALFLEVVRLGETQEKNAETIASMQAAFESRLQVIESKYQSNERNVGSLMQKGDKSLNYLNDWNDKLEKRIQNMETHMLTMGREQLKDKESLNKIETVNYRLTEDIKSLLNNLQTDYQMKLESRVTELVNRIVMEHEERVRTQEDFKNQVDLKDRLNSDKINYEREEMRDRYKSMDSLVRAEFQRKDEALRTLQAIFENQVRALQTSLKQEESARIQGEGLVREDFLKFQEFSRKEFDMFKNQNSNIMEKITEMIKIEIDARLSSDIDLKNLANAIAADLIADMNTLKDGIELQNKKFGKDIKDISIESADRAAQLSRYVDDQNNKIMEITNKKHEKIKSVFTKLAEQFKNSLISSEAQRKETASKITGLEKGIVELRRELMTILQNIEMNFENKLLEEKENLESLINSKYKVLDDKTNKLQEQENADVSILKESIETTRTIFNGKITKLNEQSEANARAFEEKLAAQLKHINEVNRTLQEVEKQITEHIMEIVERIHLTDGRIYSQVLAERALRNSQFEQMYNTFRDTVNDMGGNMLNIKTMIQNEQRERSFKEAQQSEELLRVSKSLDDTREDVKKSIEQIEANHIELKYDYEGFIAEFKLNDIFFRAEHFNISDQIGILMDSNTIGEQHRVDFQAQTLTSLDEIRAELRRLDDKMVEELRENYEKKLQAWVEKIKKDNHDLWEESVRNATEGFKNLDIIKPADYKPTHKLNELMAFGDNNFKPQVRKANVYEGKQKV